MRIRGIVSIVAIVFWAMSQTAMAFAHAPENGPRQHHTEIASTMSDAHQMTDCPMHAQVAHDQHGHGSPKNQHDHQDMTDCCGIACSLLFGIVLSDLKPKLPAKAFNKGALAALVSITIDLTTPPPNTTS